MLPDKMAISHSNHLFVPAVFVFCLLSLLVQAENSEDYTDSRQLEKNLAVSRQRNNIQWLPNYNWKPPEHYGLRKESMEKKAGMKFTKSENPEHRIADPWIKKMQEISRRQKREKWVPYKRNENEKLALDNVEETTRANKITNDESITQLDPTILMTLAQPSIDQDNASVKDLHDSSLLQSADTNIDGSNRKLDLWNTSVENPSAEIIQEAHAVSHQRHKDYEISDIKEDPFDAETTTVADCARSELEEDRSVTSKIDSHSKELISQESKIQSSSDNMRRNIKKYSNSNENLNYENNSKESPVKEYPRQPNLLQNDKEKSSKDSMMRHDEKIVTTKPLTRKSKEEEDDAGEKDATGRPLNHGGSFQPGRWGMSILSPPMEFLENIFRLSMKNKEHTEGKKDEKHDLVDQWGMSVTSLPKEFLEDILHGVRHLIMKSGSRPSQIKGSSDHRSLVHPSYQNSQANPIQRLIIDEHNKKLAETSYGKVPNDFYPSRYPKLNYWNNYKTNIDLNNRLLLRNLKFLTQALQSYIEQNDVDIPMSCPIQVPIRPIPYLKKVIR
ncbi:uncharacterized protein [Polyergus mexicanus]|uniref:uncharacterized protein n=1 Tax=Polyergus mexicanus TaxID=615972 RepID=UPI0038B5EFE1